MNDDPQGRRRGSLKLRLAATTLVVILVLLIVPPFISVSRYRNRISQLISASLGRPVRISSAELRMLPRPSFVLTDLIVDEDLAYGAEPILHANTVTAAIRLLSLWRGRLQIDRISVDEASVNLVHTRTGQWNLDALFQTAGQAGAGSSRAVPFPYLEATNSRINIKDGVEKLPYSLVNSEISFWREDAGTWRVRLRGQPARTDVNLDLPDTGIVRLEATLRRAQDLRNMPLRLDLDWREAQLGQLSRLIIGSDEGWRGDLTGEMHVDGTVDSAQVKMRLRASGVHRAEFAPASPMDFDASCNLVYHYASRGMENLLCDSPVGEGRARLTGNVESGHEPRMTVELDRVPVQVALDTLRTLRSGIDPGIQVSGAVSGRLDYAPVVADSTLISNSSIATGARQSGSRKPRNRPHVEPAGPLTGGLIVAGLRLTGGPLARPLQIAKVSIDAVAGQPSALLASTSVPMGGAAPLAVSARLGLSGYAADVRGSASYAELHNLLELGGERAATALGRVSGTAPGIEMHAEGPWVLPRSPAISGSVIDGSTPASALVSGPLDQVTATVTVHDANWQADFLPTPLEITSGTLRADASGMRWDPVSFTFGSVKGTGSLSFPARCPPDDPCVPHLTAHFDSIDSAAIQAAILGAKRPGTLLSSLMARLRPSEPNGWPSLLGTLTADALSLGPVTLNKASATVEVAPEGTKIASFAADLLGGTVSGSGAVTPGARPSYQFEGQFNKLRAPDVGQLLAMNWSGDEISGNGKIELSGLTENELASSARGNVHFEWRQGAVLGGDSPDLELPETLNKFDRWTADAEIANNAVVLKQNQVLRDGRRSSVEGSAEFGDPPRVMFGPAPEASSARR